VGGNTSSQTLLSITATTTYEAPYALSRPPLDPNFNSLFYNLELRGESLDKNALYIMDGGGNDIGNGQVFDPATAAVVAGNMVDGANALRDRGARYVVIANVPDFGLAPAGVPFADFATTQATEVNSQIRQLVGSQNILIYDAFTVLQEVAADPTAYGLPLDSFTFSRACFSTSAGTCAGGEADAKITGTNPDPDQFFFNDPLHPTTIGQDISAGYMLSVLRAPGEIALLPQMGIDDMRSQWRSAQPIMRANRYDTATPVHSYTIWGGANWNEDKHQTDYDNTGTNKATQYNLGLVFRPAANWYIGGQLGRADNELDFGASASRYEMESLDLTLLGGFVYSQWFGEAAISYSDLDYNSLKRRFSLGPVLQRTETANTSGEALGISLTGGLNLIPASKSYRLGPTWGYDYIDAEVDGYKEKSGSATALRVNDMKSSTSTANVGLFGDLKLGFCACEIYGDATYQSYLDNGATNPRIGMVSVPGNSAKLPGYEQDDDAWRWNLGLAAALGRKMTLNLGGGGTDADNGDGFWYGAELSYSF
jgi:outer membrane lipase/esterase